MLSLAFQKSTVVSGHSLLLPDDILQPRNHLVLGQWAKAETGASGLQGRDNLRQVVTDHAESGIFCELLND